MKDKLLAMLKTLGLYSEEKKAEIEKALEDLKLDEGKKSDGGGQKSDAKTELPKEVMEQLAALAEQNKQLFAALAEEKKSREEANKAIQEKMKADKAKQITDFIEKNKARIPPSDIEEVKKNLEKDFDAYSKLIAKLPEDPAMKKGQKQDASTGSASAQAREGIMRSAPQSILDNVVKYAQISDN